MHRIIPLITALTLTASNAFAQEDHNNSPDAPLDIDEACTLLANSVETSREALERALRSYEGLKTISSETAAPFQHLADVWQNNLDASLETYNALCVEGPSIG